MRALVNQYKRIARRVWESGPRQLMDDELHEEDQEQDSREQPDSDLPSGIARLREEWVKQGLVSSDRDDKAHVGLEPVIFPEPVGDYAVPAEEARARLGLTEEAMGRLLEGGELDSILVRFGDSIRRMVSQTALARFIKDAGMEPSLAEGPSTQPHELTGALDDILHEIRDVRELQSRQLQQFKDVLLLELRNLKDQDRDLTSFIYDLTAALEELFPKLRKRKRTTPETGKSAASDQPASHEGPEGEKGAE